MRSRRAQTSGWATRHRPCQLRQSHGNTWTHVCNANWRSCLGGGCHDPGQFQGLTGGFRVFSMPHALLYDAIIPPSQAIAAKSRSGSSKEMPGRRLVDGTFNSRNLNHLNLRGSKLQLFELEFLMESIARDSARLEGGTGVYLGGAHICLPCIPIFHYCVQLEKYL